MSLQGLVSGSECALPSNPLSQVLKHADSDRSIQQQRTVGPSAPRLQHLPGTSRQAASEHDLTLARQFFEATAPPPLALTSARRLELQSIAKPHAGDINLREAWTRMEQQPQRMLEGPLAQSNWATEFDVRHRLNDMSVQQARVADIQQPTLYPSQNFYPRTMPTLGMYGSSMPMLQGISTSSAPVISTGKGKARETDLDAAFADAAASLAAEITNITDTLNNTQLDEQGQGNNDIQAVWDELGTNKPPETADIAAWEAQMEQLLSAEREELEHDYGADMQRAWNTNSNAFQEDALQFDDAGYPVLGSYAFDPNNKYLNPEYSTTLKDAKELLDNGGSLSESALLLEAAIQKGDLGEGGYEAWILLGETRNMDERGDLGLQALVEGVKRAESSGSAAGMLSLAISYTNENFDRASYSTLLQWLRARFSTHPVPEDLIQAMPRDTLWDIHARLTDLFIGLARSQHQHGVVDPEVQLALGTLFYTNGDYDRSKDCFETALKVRPKDYLLWNRLGSCLSNGSRPEEALVTYREALSLRPTYTRAICNVGVACLNIGAHKEAAEHFLSALAMQEANSGGKSSEQLWMTLRRVFTVMERPDLTHMCGSYAHAAFDFFRKEGFDF